MTNIAQAMKNADKATQDEQSEAMVAILNIDLMLRRNLFNATTYSVADLNRLCEVFKLYGIGEPEKFTTSLPPRATGAAAAV